MSNAQVSIDLIFDIAECGINGKVYPATEIFPSVIEMYSPLFILKHPTKELYLYKFTRLGKEEEAYRLYDGLLHIKETKLPIIDTNYFIDTNYWEFLKENQKIVSQWPKWKQGARGELNE